VSIHRFFLAPVLAALLIGGCASAPGRPPAGRGGAADAVARRVVVDARAFTGTAYRPGGADPAGFDCSGFVQYLYGQRGIGLPRTAHDQFRSGRRIQPGRITAGDLVFFRTAGRRVSHVGIATGDGAFLHAPSVGSRVRIDRLDAPYWARRFAGARRVTR
jgi:cell wall-associated NlpC family hydrolase